MKIPTKTAASSLMTAARVTVLFGCALFALRTVWWEVAAVTEVYGPWWPALLQATLLLGFLAIAGRWATALVLWVGSVSLVRLISRIKFEYLHSPLDASDLRQLDLQSLQQTLVQYPWIVAAVSAAATAAFAGWLIVAGIGRPLGGRARLLSLALAALFAAAQYRALSQLPQEGDLMESRSLMALALSFFLRPADLEVPAAAVTVTPHVSCPAEPTDVMVVLQESTFRTRQAGLSDDVSLRRFFGGDAYAGQLKVHVYGGKTHLTDFAFLIGLPHLALTGEREYLSRTLVGRIDHSLPLALRRCGYESTVIYPVAKNYFNALNWFVAVGFDHVISPEDVGLGGADAWHMADERFFEQALKVAKAARKPQLIYVLTIAQHGPHDQVGGAQGAQDEYHRRLLASARAFDGLVDALGALGAGRPWLLAWFGDHRPHRIGDGDGGNPYTTWATVRRVGNGAAAPLPELPAGVDIAFFGHLLLRSIGVRTEPLGALVDAMLEDCAPDYFQCSEALRHEHQRALRSVGAIRPVSGAASPLQ